ncbi:MAG: FAD-binding oxidoreductase [Patescibacteria group bacterium]
MLSKSADCVVIGGGFYGCCVALYMRQFVEHVIILEQGSDLLTRASYANQARVHNGYHYPRSFVTALRSRVNFPRFVEEFEQAIQSDFTKTYAISKQNSKVNAGQFKQFCQHIQAEYATAPAEVRDLFNPNMIEEVFVVKEYAFDAKKLAEMLKRKLVEQGIEVRYNSSAKTVKQAAGDRVEVELESGDKLNAHWVFNCTYSQINTLLERSGLERLPLKHEITEMALIDVPLELKKVGATVMDGPFFSAMPFPARSLHTLSHVRYTPRYSWSDQEEYQNGEEVLSRMEQRSNFAYMLKDAQRFIPSLGAARQVDSLFEIKTVLVQNEMDDGRPILFRKDYGLKNFSVIMGGKIDNIYDILEAFKQTGNFGF